MANSKNIHPTELKKIASELSEFNSCSEAEALSMIEQNDRRKDKVATSALESATERAIRWRDDILMHLSLYEGKQTILSLKGGAGTEALFFFEAGYDVLFFEEDESLRDYASRRFRRYASNIKVVKSLKEAATVAGASVLLAPSVEEGFQQLKKIVSCLPKGSLVYLAVAHSEDDSDLQKQLVQLGFSILDRISEGDILVLGKFGVVDIIIPTYNAIDYVKECISSVRTWTQDVPYRLVLVNDKSPDENIDKFYRLAAKRNDIYITNEKNLGFVQTVNRGLVQSDENDVVLLNTDTVVSENWLSRLQRTIYTKTRYATANPASNNASIYSIQDLAELDPESLNEAGKAIALTSQRIYPEVPVTVGFCVYIKRNILQELGGLDEIFGKGYGEESDFCLRCRKAGYSHILVDDAFVFHKGSISMLPAGVISEGQISVPKNEEILLKRYPEYPALVREFLESDSLKKIKHATKLGFMSSISQRRQKILFLIHEDITADNIGGTEYHLRDLIGGLKGKYACYALHVKDRSTVVIHEYVGGLLASYEFSIPEIKPYTLRDNYMSTFYQRILQIFEIDIVHVHHFIKNSFDIIFSAKSLNIPVFMTLHDYYAVSPDYNLLYKYGIKKVSPGHIDEYHENFTHQKGFKLSEWQEMTQRLLGPVNLLIFPSETARQEILSQFTRIRLDRTLVVPHGETLEGSNFSYGSYQKADSKKFSVLFLGYTHDEQKGGKLIAQIIPKLLSQGVEVHLLGTAKENWKNFKGKDELIFHGRYKRDDLVEIIKSINPRVIALPSPWPETYSYTLTESLMARVPVVCFDIGAVAERIKDYGTGGFIVDEISADAFVRKISEIAEDEEKYTAVKQGLDSLHIKSLAENVAEYDGLYQKFIQTKADQSTKGWERLELKRAAYIQSQEQRDIVELRERVRKLQILIKYWEKSRRFIPRSLRSAAKKTILKAIR